ncbi:MAG: hypothetical protein B7X79_16520 [Acidovorax sp. 17-64-282]|nr:MAG: hypothetical protein B7X79_16520 [Acidovorax sp. 17-64-282]
MLKTLKDLFDSFAQPAPSQSPAQREHAVQLAAAVLLVEVVRSESSMDTAERTTMVAALRGKFALSDDELERLLELAVTTSRTAYDYQRFTSSLNARVDVVAHQRQIALHCGGVHVLPVST